MHNHKMLCITLLSTFLGIISGIWFPDQMLNIKWIDTLIINLFKLIAIPIIFCALVNAIILMGRSKLLRLVWFYTSCYVLLSVSIAVTIGIVLLNIFNPGKNLSPDLINLHTTSSQLELLNSSSTFFNTILPSNKIGAASNFEFIPIIVFGIIFGIACVSTGKSANPLITLFSIISDVFNKIVKWLMYLTPIALFGLFGAAIAEAYTKHILLESITGLSSFLVIFLIGLLIQFLWQFALVKFFLKRNSKSFLKNGTKALLMAFATSNSLSTLPITLLVAKEEKIKKDVADFVLPFSTVINLAGTAMYEAVSALFFCQILNIHLSILSQIGIFCTAILAGIGAGGIPEGGLITMVIVLKSINIPTSAIAILLPFDRILDRLRTTVNVWGDLVCALTVNYLIRRKTRVASQDE